MSELVLTPGTRAVRTGKPRPVTWARCGFCEESYRTTPSDLAASGTGYCSRACAELAQMLAAAQQREVG